MKNFWKWYDKNYADIATIVIYLLLLLCVALVATSHAQMETLDTDVATGHCVVTSLGPNAGFAVACDNYDPKVGTKLLPIMNNFTVPGIRLRRQAAAQEIANIEAVLTALHLTFMPTNPVTPAITIAGQP